MKYEIANAKGDFYGTKKLSFDILEDGIAIARVTRSARACWGMMEYTFYSERAAHRFTDYCDSLSRDETCEALFTHLKK